MKIMSDWLENVIEDIDNRKNVSSAFLLVLLVLVLGAGSLYMLINTPA